MLELHLTSAGHCSVVRGHFIGAVRNTTLKFHSADENLNLLSAYVHDRLDQ